MTAFVDTNIVIRHLTQDPPDAAARATEYLSQAEELLLPDVIVAEIVYVLESHYKVQSPEIARLLRAVVAFGAIRTTDPALLLRALQVYESSGIDFAEAYLVALAEVTGVGVIASFDRSIDRIPSVERIEP